MRQKAVFISLFTLGAIFGATSCSKTDKAQTTTPETTASAQSQEKGDPALTEFFAANVGKTAHEIPGFFSTSALHSRLRELVGVEMLGKIENNWQTQVPIEKMGSCYVTGGMKAHSGSNPGFTIVYNPATDNLSVAYTVDGKTEVMQNHKEDISKYMQF